MNDRMRRAKRSFLPLLVRTVVVLAATLSPVAAHAAILQAVVVSQVVDEGAPAQIAVVLTRESGDVGACTVDGTLTTTDGSAQAGSDYAALNVPFSVTLGAADGTVQQEFTLTVLEDVLFELSEFFSFVATENPPSCPFTVVNNGDFFAGIVDNDPLPASITFNQSVVSVNEADGTATIQVSLVGSANIVPRFDASVTINFVDGTAQQGADFDAANVPRFLQFFSDTPASLTQQIVVPLVDDAVAEPNEAFTIQLSAGNMNFPDEESSALLPTGPDVTVAIADDDNPGSLQFGTPSLQVAENVAGGIASFTVTRVGGAGGAVSVDFAANTGLGTPNVDYVPVNGTLTWADRDVAPKTFDVTILDDALVDPNETVTPTLSNPTGGATLGSPATTTLTIVDDDAPPGGGGDENISAPVGTTATVTFAVTGSGPFTLAAQTGTVTPTTLPAPGNATYTLDVDPAAQVGSTINDVITITDGAGNATTKQVAIQVQAALARDVSAIPNLTPNQLQLATYFDDLCPRLTSQGPTSPDQAQLIDVCTGLRDPATSDAQVAEALDQTSAEEVITAATTTLRLSGLQHGNLAERINGLRSGATGIDVAGLQLEIEGQTINGAALAEAIDNTVWKLLDVLSGGAASADEFARWGLFLNGKFSYGDKDETENEAGFDFDAIGVTGGVDYRFDQNLVLGLAIGYAAVESDFDDDRGSLDIDSWSGSLFGTYFVADRFYIDGTLTLGQNDYESVRHIMYTDAIQTFDETAKGDTDGMQFSGGLASGLDFNNGKWTFGPHIGLDYYDVDVDELAESGAGAFNLVIGDQTARSFTANGGAHVSYAYTAQWGVLVPHVRLDFVHEFEDGREGVAIRIAADPFSVDPSNPTPLIELETDPTDSDYVVWSAGVSAQFINGLAGFVSYRSTAGFDDFSVSDITYGLRLERSF